MAEVIVHSHWDREWFVPLSVTKRWLGQLFHGILTAVERNPEYRFVLDGQTALVDDWLATLDEEERQQGEAKLRRYADRLTLGPYVGQVDWRIAEESAVRNLALGQAAARRYGEPLACGWLVDNFGFSSQVPQLNRGFGIDQLVAWRGFDVADGPSVNLRWQGSDGSEVAVMVLLDSYRNLMRLCDHPQVAEQRLQLEIEKLTPHSLSEHIPLLDGYDLDPTVEDPTTILNVELVTPDTLLERARGAGMEGWPLVHGEQLSGRVVCTFPGSLATRPYLKLQHWWCEQVLRSIVEPLQWLVSDDEPLDEAWTLVLHNLIHDSIGGVSVDQVHHDMERRYEKVQKQVDGLLQRLLERLPGGRGWWAFNLNPSPATVAFRHEDAIVTARVRGGTFGRPVVETHALKTVDEQVNAWKWSNEHFTLDFDDKGLTIGEWCLRPLLVRDKGDTYSDGFAEGLPLLPSSLAITGRSDDGVVVRQRWESEQVGLEIEYLCTSLPTVELRTFIDGRGCDYALLLRLEGEGQVIAGMPFDRVRRDDLIAYEEPRGAIEPFLVAAREVGECRTFPCKDLVGLEQGDVTCALFPRGIYAYTTHGPGRGAGVVLQRAVEWIARSDVPGRVGDAGPAMYVPGARCQRIMELEVGLYLGPTEKLTQWKGAFCTPPMILWFSGDGVEQELQFYEAPGAEFAALTQGKLRLFNGGDGPVMAKMRKPATEVTLAGEPLGTFDGAIAPHEIVTVELGRAMSGDEGGKAELIYPRLWWQVGEERARPDKRIVGHMRVQAQDLKTQARAAQERIASSEGVERYRHEFEFYKLERHALELELSAVLVEGADVESDSVLALADALNNLRVKRRSVEFLLATLAE